MKTRSGFVSNSSSSSFILVGETVSMYEAFELSYKMDKDAFFKHIHRVLSTLVDSFLNECDNEEYEEAYNEMGISGITADNLFTVFDGNLMHHLAENARDYDVLYDIPYNDGLSFSYSFDDWNGELEGAIGITVGSVDYGIEEQVDVSEVIKIAAKLATHGFTDPSIITVYTDN